MLFFIYAIIGMQVGIVYHLPPKWKRRNYSSLTIYWPRQFVVLKLFEVACVWLVYSTGILRNELIIMWICQRSAYFSFIPSTCAHTHTHTHTHTPFEDHAPTGVKLDIAHKLQGKEHPCVCIPCDKFLAWEHILLHCADLAGVRDKCFQTCSLGTLCQEHLCTRYFWHSSWRRENIFHQS